MGGFITDVSYTGFNYVSVVNKAPKMIWNPICLLIYAVAALLPVGVVCLVPVADLGLLPILATIAPRYALGI